MTEAESFNDILDVERPLNGYIDWWGIHHCQWKQKNNAITPMYWYSNVASSCVPTWATPLVRFSLISEKMQTLRKKLKLMNFSHQLYPQKKFSMAKFMNVTHANISTNENYQEKKKVSELSNNAAFLWILSSLSINHVTNVTSTSVIWRSVKLHLVRYNLVYILRWLQYGLPKCGAFPIELISMSEISKSSVLHQK